MFDNSLKKNKYKSNNENYNLKNKLLQDKKVDKNFLHKLNFLTIEELIYLKLDSATTGLNGKLFNFPILKFSADIMKEACIKYALSASTSKKHASMILGITKVELNRLIRLYNIKLGND